MSDNTTLNKQIKIGVLAVKGAFAEHRQILEKLVDVVQAKDHTGTDAVEKELALIKVRCTAEQRTEILQLCDHFHANTVDMTMTSMIIQITGNSVKVDTLKSLLQKFEIVEYIRTGKVIMLRGEDKT